VLDLVHELNAFHSDSLAGLGAGFPRKPKASVSLVVKFYTASSSLVKNMAVLDDCRKMRDPIGRSMRQLTIGMCIRDGLATRLKFLFIKAAFLSFTTSHKHHDILKSCLPRRLGARSDDWDFLESAHHDLLISV
jgi:hypothetical protein